LPRPVQAGGGQGTSTATSSSPAGASTSNTSTGGADRADPTAVYTAWWTVLERALATANSSDPDLSTYGTNPLLSTTRARLIALKTQQVVQVVRFTHQQRIANRTPTRVDILDCIGAPAGTYRDARTGQPRAPDGIRNDIATHDSVRSVLQLVGGIWYMTAIQAGGQPC
jgi:hypothetical protein